MTELTSLEELESCLGRSETGPVLILKHSTACPISAAAYEQVLAYEKGRADNGPEVNLIKVIEARPVSNAAARALGVVHRSPQVLLVKEGKAVWSASHYGITREAISSAVKQHAG